MNPAILVYEGLVPHPQGDNWIFVISWFAVDHHQNGLSSMNNVADFATTPENVAWDYVVREKMREKALHRLLEVWNTGPFSH